MSLKELWLAVQNGNVKRTQELVLQGMENKISPIDILNEGLIAAMEDAATKFRSSEIFVPEMLIIARAMNAGVKILEPILIETGVKPIGKAVIGTVKGDLHDIGKNLVKMMMKGSGIEVVDIGVDVPNARFVEKAEEIGADIVCISAMLTTTMEAIREVIKEFTKAGIKDKYIFMIGGGPVSRNFAKQIRADFYTPNAFVAAEIAKQYLRNKEINYLSQPV